MAKVPSKVEEMDKAAEELLKAGEKKEEEVIEEPITPDSDDPEVKPDDQKQPDEVKDDVWEQRYKTIEGKYKAEVPRMAETIRNLENIVKDLTEKAVSAPSSKGDTVKEDEDEAWLKKEYPDFYRALNKMINKNTGSADEIAKKLKELEGKTTYTAEQAFYKGLEERVSDWRDYNFDPDFKTWLQEEDGYTGMPKSQLLQVAYSNFNHKAVAKFFEDFKATKEVKDTTSTDTTKDKKLDKQVTPSSRPSKSGKETEINEVTPEVVEQYSKKLRKLVNDKDYEGAEKLEKELDALLMKAR